MSLTLEFSTKDGNSKPLDEMYKDDSNYPITCKILYTCSSGDKQVKNFDILKNTNEMNCRKLHAYLKEYISNDIDCTASSEFLTLTKKGTKTVSSLSDIVDDCWGQIDIKIKNKSAAEKVYDIYKNNRFRPLLTTYLLRTNNKEKDKK